MTLNYQVSVERHSFPNGAGSSNPVVKSSMYLRKNKLAKSVPTRPGMGHATPKLGHPGFLGGGTGIN